MCVCVCICVCIHIIVMYIAFVFGQFLAACFIELLMFYCKMY